MKTEKEIQCPMCQYKFKDELALSEAEKLAQAICGQERPLRDVLCQLQKGHAGRHVAVIFWE